MSDGEEWKGEEPQPAGGFFGWHMLQWTPEMAAKEAEARRRRIAEGNLAYETLGGFALSRPCPKCRAQETAKVRYVAAGQHESRLGEHDALERTCRRCRYQWYERTEDAS